MAGAENTEPAMIEEDATRFVRDSAQRGVRGDLKTENALGSRCDGGWKRLTRDWTLAEPLLHKRPRRVVR